jgi:predicted dehydrogenase
MVDVIRLGVIGCGSIVQDGAEPFCDLIKARESIRLANAADRSLAEGRIIEV